MKRSGQADARIVTTAAVVLAGAVALWGLITHRLLLYGDATAHLMIARRMLDSATPGLSQWGSVWLPFPHLLMAPWAQVDWLWRTGLAGSLVSLVAFAWAAHSLYCLTRRLAGPGVAAAAGLIFICNPSLVYLASVPMTESVYLMCFLGVVERISAWVEIFAHQPSNPKAAGQGAQNGAAGTGSYRYIWQAGAWALAGSLTRYDGWFILPFCTLAIACAARPTFRRWRGAWAGVWRFCVLAGCGPIFWFAYNAYYFGDWLSFARGPYSARQIYLRALRHGGQRYPGDHNWHLALLYFLKAVELDCGWPVLWLGLAGCAWLAAWLWRNRSTAGENNSLISSVASWIWLLLLLPLFWYPWAMWTGNVPIFVPPYWPHGYYNLRYGIQLLPALALGLGWLLMRVRKSKWLAERRMPAGWSASWARQAIYFALCFWLVLNYGFMLRGRGPLVYAEASYNAPGRLAMEHQLAAVLRQVRPGQRILMYVGTFPGALADDGIALHRVICETNYRLWEHALAAPARYVSWVVLERHTWLAHDLNRGALARGFHPVARLHVPGQHTITIYHRTKG